MWGFISWLKWWDDEGSGTPPPPAVTYIGDVAWVVEPAYVFRISVT